MVTTVKRLREAGHWDRFCELRRIKKRAAKKMEPEALFEVYPGELAILLGIYYVDLV